MEQTLIDSSIKVNSQKQEIVASLPFIDDATKLSPNKNIALKIYYQQLKKLESHQADKDDIIASEAKLGYGDYVHNLPQEMQEALINSSTQNFIPWRAVWKPSSISTPCRIQHHQDTA